MRRLIQRWLTLEPIRERAERRENAKALRDTYDCLDEIADHLIDAIAWKDDRQRIARFNESTSRAARSRRFDPQP